MALRATEGDESSPREGAGDEMQKVAAEQMDKVLTPLVVKEGKGKAS